MTRYHDDTKFLPSVAIEIEGYQEGVDRVLKYIESIHRYPKLVAELKWAIEEGII